MTIHLAATERRLSPTEQAVLSVDHVCSLNFAMHCRLQGPLNQTQLQAALTQAQHRHPLLRMRIRAEHGGYWFRTEGVGPIPLRIVECPPENLTAEAEYEARTQVDWSQGPLARCVWLRHGPDQSTLLLTFHHVIGDGISGSFLIRDILQALAGETLSALPLAESLDGHLPAQARGLRGALGYLGMLARMIGWILQRGLPRALPIEVKAPYTQRRANLLMLQFDPHFTQALAARARAEQTTVHAALAAAIALSCYPDMQADHAHVLFGSPLNMRDRFDPPIGEDIGFYVAMGVSSVQLHARSQFWDLARDIKGGLNHAIAIGLPFYGLTGLAPILVGLARLAGGGSRGMHAVARGWDAVMAPAMGLTNIGRAKINEQYGAFKVSALGFVASISVLGSYAFTATTLGDTLCLNFIAMEPLVSPATQARVAERVRSLLGQML